MTPRTHHLAPLVLAFALSGCAVFGDDDEPAPPIEVVPTELADMNNISVCGDVWLGELPSAHAIDIAGRRGIRTLISLLPTDAPEDVTVAAECERLGLRFVRIGVDAESLSDADVDRVLAALESEDRGPVLLYCKSGSLAMMFFAIWRATRDGIPVESALESARRGGMTPGYSNFVRAQVARLSA